MKTNKKVFFSIGDSKYFHVIQTSLKQLRKIYPDSDFYIYDWGFSDEQRSILNKYSKIIPWKITDNKPLFNLNVFEKIKKYAGANSIKEFFYKLINNRNRLFKKDNIKSIIYTENLFQNKLLCIIDFINNHEGPSVFIDGDAFLIKNIDETFNNNFDIGLTIRPKKEMLFGKNKCAVINTGVIFFSKNSNKNKKFVESWYKEMLNCKELVVEQTSLVRLLEKNGLNFNQFEDYQGITIDNEKYSIKLFPCKIYNYNWIEEFEKDPNKDLVKILHFKSGRFKLETWRGLIKNIKDK